MAFIIEGVRPMRYWKIMLITLGIGLQPTALAGTPVTLYKNPSCACCDIYADYLKGNGFDVKIVNTTDMASIKRKHGVPEKLEGCHTAVAGRYVFEGLIPVKYVKRVLNEQRPLKGLSLPGMPSGVPGMPGVKRGPLHVYYLSGESNPTVFATF